MAAAKLNVFHWHLTEQSGLALRLLPRGIQALQAEGQRRAVYTPGRQMKRLVRTRRTAAFAWCQNRYAQYVGGDCGGL